MRNFTEKLKQFGAKVNRVKDSNGNFYKGVYKYNGVNFDAVVNDAECESKWWEVDLIGVYEKTPYNAFLSIQFDDYNTFTTKKEVIGSLLGLDEAISENINEWISKINERITLERRLIESYPCSYENTYRAERIKSLESTKARITKK